MERTVNFDRLACKFRFIIVWAYSELLWVLVMLLMPRRRFSCLATIPIITPSLLAISAKSVFGQDQSSFEKALLQARSDAEAVVANAERAFPLIIDPKSSFLASQKGPPPTFPDVIKDDYELRLKLARSAEEIPSATRQKILADIVRAQSEGFRELADLYEAEKISPVPDSNEITPLSFDPIAEVGCDEDKMVVVFEIIMEALGIQLSGNLAMEFFQDDRILGDVTRISDAVKRRDWVRLRTLILEFLGRFVRQPKLLISILDKVVKGSGPQLLKAVAGRAIPILGQFYWAVCAGVAIKNHWARLTC